MQCGQEMMALAKQLFPLCRSLTGQGVRQSLALLQQVVPLSLHEIPSGTQAFDWTVPDEWQVREAYFLDPAGHRMADFSQSNLHLVGYSAPFDGALSLEELQPHLHSDPNRPHAIPYVTSYYARNWGFCLPHSQRLALQPGRYYVKIDTSLQAGFLTYGDLVIPGDSSQEILISTYICHPSMANNELSGPLVAAFLARELLLRKKRRWSYRFVFVPETVGAIVYLSRHLEHLQKQVIAGYVLTCIGDGSPFSYIETRGADSLVDRITRHVFRHAAPEHRWYSWQCRGSDERQYNWPGIDLPIGSLMRAKHGTYPEYHTSDDNLELLSSKSFEESVQMALQCIEALECNRTYRCQSRCEPQLGKRGLYPQLSTRDSGQQARLLLDLLAYSDGTQDLLAIAERLHKPITELAANAALLVNQGLLAVIYTENH